MVSSPIIVTRNSVMQKLLEMARTVAPTKANVLLLGESGTGKELFAKLIHNSSYRKDRGLIAINCAALPETLVESELFGFEKGSFSGSVATKPGRFEKASGSTLLLDEISEMNCHVQAKLLRVIQECQIERLGALDTIDVDLRIIATSNKNLYSEVRAGRFREDLYHRLNVVVLKIPPLRERPEDIDPLIEYFIKQSGREYGKDIRFVDSRIMKELHNYSYPGNVRELKNIIERGVLFSEKGHLSVEYIVFENAGILPTGNLLKVNEKEVILKILRSSGNNRTRAAERLGISVRTLRNRLRQYREEGGVVT